MTNMLVDSSGVTINIGETQASKGSSGIVGTLLSAVGLGTTPIFSQGTGSTFTTSYGTAKFIGPAPQPAFGIKSCPAGQNVYYDGQIAMCA